LATPCGPDPILARWILPGSVLPDLTAESAPGALDELVDAVAGTLPGVSRAALRQGFAEREALGSTAVGGGFAIPHCRIAGPRELVLRVARHPAGVDFGAPDGRPVNVFFAVVAPTSAAATHLEALRAIARYVREPGRLARLLAARGTEELRQRLLEAAVPGLHDVPQRETAGV
jgi:PTS system nitrogen regulatory IIA component